MYLKFRPFCWCCCWGKMFWMEWQMCFGLYWFLFSFHFVYTIKTSTHYQHNKQWLYTAKCVCLQRVIWLYNKLSAKKQEEACWSFSLAILHYSFFSSYISVFHGNLREHMVECQHLVHVRSATFIQAISSQQLPNFHLLWCLQGKQVLTIWVRVT